VYSHMKNFSCCFFEPRISSSTDDQCSEKINWFFRRKSIARQMHSCNELKNTNARLHDGRIWQVLEARIIIMDMSRITCRINPGQAIPNLNEYHMGKICEDLPRTRKIRIVGL
jgi:hypothetical protein